MVQENISTDNTANGSNPFDPARFRLRIDFGESIKTRKEFVSIPVRKPTRFEWIRTHTDLGYWFDTRLLTTPEEREPYLLDPSLWEMLSSDSRPVRLVPVMTRLSGIFLWVLNLPNSAGKHNGWNESAHAAAERAQTQWLRVVANQKIKAYEIVTAKVEIAEPDFPDLSLATLLERAFRNRVIESPDHPILRTLRGEI